VIRSDFLAISSVAVIDFIYVFTDAKLTALSHFDYLYVQMAANNHKSSSRKLGTKKLKRNRVNSKKELKRTGRYWRVIARYAVNQQKYADKPCYKEVARRWWKFLFVGKRLGRRTLSGAAKIVAKYVERWNNGEGSKTAGLNNCLRKLWPNVREIYDSSDESKIPADNTWNYDKDSEYI
jgi:hypothetical protein